MKNTYRTWVEVDKNIFERNIDLLKSKLKHGVKFAGVVKANAYGHGIIQISKLLSKKNPAFLAVTYIEEAIELRENNIAIPILMLSQPFIEDIPAITKYKITPTVCTVDFARTLSAQAIKKNTRVSIHIKIETGLNRLGFQLETAENSVKNISNLSGLKIEGIYSHFSSAFSRKDSITEGQLAKFLTLIEKLEKNKIFPDYVHIANSAGYIWFPKTQCNLVRFGLAMYGLEPSTQTKYPLQIKQCFTWKTKILQIKEIKKGEYVGYGKKWKASKKTTIATIAVGYADGFRRSPYNFGYVLCNGYEAKTVGDITMSLSMIDVSSIPNISLEDEVVIIGKQKNREITFEEIAKHVKTINEEIATSISSKIPRIYKSN